MNLRDVGGHRTIDGRHVRQRRLFRSGQLSQLSDRDYELVASLGLSVVCDFRTDDERTAAPLRWRGTPIPDVPHLPTPSTGGASVVKELLCTGVTGEEMSAWMHNAYASIPVAYGPAYRATLQQVVTGSGPVLYHCTAGKDRTGVFTALLLSWLGVPRKTIEEEYLLSNAAAPSASEISGFAKRSNASVEALRAALFVERSYLNEAFKAIEHRFGSIDNYRRTELTLSDSDLERLKALLLEP